MTFRISEIFKSIYGTSNIIGPYRFSGLSGKFLPGMPDDIQSSNVATVVVTPGSGSNPATSNIVFQKVYNNNIALKTLRQNVLSNVGSNTSNLSEAINSAIKTVVSTSSSNINSWFPPIAMTSNVLVYGGTYVASVSSSIGVNNQAFHAFDATDTFTHTAYSMYDGNGIYLGSNSTSFNASYSNSNVRGEWLQLSFPSKISINTLQLSSLTGYPSRMPRDFILAGCNQGDIKWNYIYLGSNQTYTTAKETKSFYFTNSNSYDTYRLVDYRHNTGDNFSTCITNMKLGRFNLTPTGFAACNISWRTVDVSWTGINYKDAKVSWGSNNYSNVSPFISSSNTYRLSNLTENTQYNLKLSLYNSIGSEGSSNGILTLKTLNPLISSLTSNAVGWSNFTVGWTSNAYDYVILSVPGRSNQRINAPLTTFTISNLTMPSSNQISVTPYSPFGYAGSSLTQTMYTLQPSVVMNAETNKTSTNVRINFSGTFGYAIAGFSNATSNLLTSNLPSGTTFYNFSNLMGAATYSFFVTPYAPNGVAGTRQTRLITMANPTLSSASTSNISADSLQVQWAGAGYGYAQVSWSNNGVLSNSPPIYLPSSNYTVSNLKPNTAYTITINSYTPNYTQTPITTNTTTLNTSISNVVATPYLNYVDLTWMGQNNRAAITWDSNSIIATGSNYTVSNLSENTLYSFTLTPQWSNVNGVFTGASNIVSTTTSSPTVSNVSVDFMTGNTAVLSWGSKAASYIIVGWSNDTSNWTSPQLPVSSSPYQLSNLVKSTTYVATVTPYLSSPYTVGNTITTNAFTTLNMTTTRTVPSAPVTGVTTLLLDGSYTINANTNSSTAYLAFDRNASTHWITASNTFSAAGALQLSTNTTSYGPGATSGTTYNYPGHHLEVVSPVNAFIRGITIVPHPTLYGNCSPSSFRIFGRTGAGTWTILMAVYGLTPIVWTADQKTWGDSNYIANTIGFTADESIAFPLASASNNYRFNQFRVAIHGVNGSLGYCAIKEVLLHAIAN